MPDVFQAFDTTVPAGTTTAAPSVQLSVGADIWQVVKVTILIPPGHACLTGIQLWYAGGPAIPYNSGWYCGDDDKIPIELGNDFPQGVPWSVAMVNSDIQSHTFQTRWEMNYIGSNTTATPAQTIAVGDLYNLDDMTTVGA